MLSADDLVAMRDTLEDSLPDTAVIQRVTSVANGMGDYTDTWAAAGTVACRVAPFGGRTPDEVAIVARFGVAAYWWLTLPAETSITSVDRVAVGSRSFELIVVNSPRSYELSCRCVAKETT